MSPYAEGFQRFFLALFCCAPVEEILDICLCSFRYIVLLSLSVQDYAGSVKCAVLDNVLQFHLIRSISFSSDNNRGHLLQDESPCSGGTLSDPLGLSSHYITAISSSGSACAKGKSEVPYHLIRIRFRDNQIKNCRG